MLLKSGYMRLTLTNQLATPSSPEGWELPVKAKAISNPDLGSGSSLPQPTVAFNSYSFENWAESSDAESTGAQSLRNFVGCLDEFAILSRALSPGEFERLYQIEKP